MVHDYILQTSHTFQTAGVAALLFLACVYLSQINSRNQFFKLPAFVTDSKGEKTRQTYIQSARTLYKEGYEKFKDGVYRMATEDGTENVVIPPRLLPELRKLPDSVLSFPKAIDNVMQVKYTKIITDEPMIVHSVRADLTPALVRLNPIICNEVDEAVQEEMPTCNDWSPVYIYPILVRIVAKASGRIFVGPKLCREKDYLDAGINYTLELIAAQRAVKNMRPWLRPFLASRLPEIVALRERERQAKEYLEPVVQARRDAEKEPGYEKPDDMLQWFLNRSKEFGINSTAYIAKLQLGIIFAAIHTTTLTATNILLTLAASPEYIEPLREEIRTVMMANDGVITSRALQQMEKLDSVMKETMRFFPPGLTSFNRRVLKGITLSNGQYIPPGPIIEVPSHAIYHDDAHYPDGDTFDGFRFYKLRQAGTATDHARNQFVTTNEVNLGFGYGRHACPGRFFAANEIKMILARLLLEYDFKNADGFLGRYPNAEIGRSSVPDAKRPLLFKKVKV